MATPVYYNTANTEGVDVTAVITISTSTPEYPAAPFLVGQTILGTDNSKWVYVTAAGAVTIGDVVTISNTFTATSITSTIAATAGYLMPLGVAAVCTTSPTTGQYFWVQTQGVCAGLSVTSAIAPQVALYTTATAGRLGVLATGSSYTVTGIITTTTSAATAGVYAGVLNFPVIGVAN